MINRPSWNQAPSWAVWLALDEDGQWFWYSEKPMWNKSFWDAQGGSTAKVNVKNFNDEIEIDSNIARHAIYLRPGKLKEFINALK